MILANVTPPTEIAAWLACFAFVVMLANQGFKLWGNLSGKAQNIAPNPLQVQEVKECVTRREFTAHVEVDREEHDKLFRKLGGVERGAIERGDARAEQINAHIEEVRRELDAKIESKTDNLQEQIKDVPHQTMSLLRNAGALKS